MGNAWDEKAALERLEAAAQPYNSDAEKRRLVAEAGALTPPGELDNNRIDQYARELGGPERLDGGRNSGRNHSL